MAFPVTPILDNFNRAGPAVGSSWTVTEAAGHGQALPQINGNQLVFASGSGNYAEAYWNGEVFGPDCEVFFDVPAFAGAGGTLWAIARLQQPDGFNTMDGYLLEYNNGSGVWTLYRGKDGTWTNLPFVSSTRFVAGGGIGLRVLGSGAVVTVQGWARLSAQDEWKIVLEYKDEHADRVTAAGYLGVRISNDTSWRVDNFGGGRYVPPVRYLPNGDQAPFLPWQMGKLH